VYDHISVCGVVFGQANQDPGTQPGPAGLVAGAATAAGAAMEVPVEGDQIAPAGIVVGEPAGAEDGPLALLIEQGPPQGTAPGSGCCFPEILV